MLQKKLLRRITLITICFIFLAIVFCNSTVSAQETKYPTRAISFIVPYSPGGSSDNAARIISMYVSKKFNHPINVVNRPGGSGTIGQQEAMAVPPDGYTILLDTNQLPGFHMVLPNIPFDWEKRTFIARVFLDPIFLVVSASSNYKTLRDVIDRAKREPDTFKWAASGPAGGATVSIGWLLHSQGVPVKRTRMISIPGGGEVMTQLAGGHLDLGQGELSSVLNMIGTGKIRPVAAILPKRHPQLPDVPTVSEAGFGEYKYELINFISGPPGLPDYVSNAWLKALGEVVNDPKFQESSTKAGKWISFGGPEEAKKTMYEYFDLFKKVYPAIGISKESK